jgi:hypothetical protein
MEIKDEEFCQQPRISLRLIFFFYACYIGLKIKSLTQKKLLDWVLGNLCASNSNLQLPMVGKVEKSISKE